MHGTYVLYVSVELNDVGMASMPAIVMCRMLLCCKSLFDFPVYRYPVQVCLDPMLCV